MAPPAGTSSMLRSRRRDATLKPNRTLDRSASRGMLYENEELRLRTININAEVEKGQSYIKKLRRENEQLKREIWNLREEYERLENYVKSREQSENEEEGEDEDEEHDDGSEEVITEESTEVAATPEISTVLETVVEEEDDVNEGDQQRDLQDRVGSIEDGENVLQGIEVINNSGNNINNSDRSNNNNYYNNVIVGVADRRQRDDEDVVVAVTCSTDCTVNPRDPVRTAASVTADVLAADVASCGGGRYDSDCSKQQDQPAVDRPGGGGDGQDPLLQGQHHLDLAVLQPHTACFETGNNRQLHDLTVDEVIDAIQDGELRDKLRTVCLTDDRCYMTFANAEYLERALHTATLRIRDVPVLLMDTGAGAVILSLTGVPDAVTDKDVLKCLKKYGTIIGGVERKTARGGTTGGERYVRVRPTLGAPRYLWFGSDKVIVRQLTEHETGTMNSIARRKSFRSHIKLNLKMAAAADPSASMQTDCESKGGEGSGSGCAVAPGAAGGVGSTAMTTTAVSVQNGFKFPTDPKTTAGGCGGPPPVTDPKTAASLCSKSTTGSPKKPAKTASPANDRDGCPPPQTASTLSGQAESSPLRGRRRTSLMGFRRETIKHRGGSITRMEGGGGEDADSDTSTICRRKLSITGRERTEKVPWCGCWGNGCL